ncbi:MAG: hypothetical protein LBT05_11650 [Planctomycetaceae bacterium]|jgi:hypothetical protein|nr:hypothetical protein [Planctomycetaceae bacterium]
MPSSLFQYEMLPTTWFYLSSLIIIAVFFKFNRFWSIRNLDVIGLMLTTPGLLFLAMNNSRAGYVWLFGCGFLFIIRLFLDLLMVRRPLLEPNLNPSGITLSVILLIAFMCANITINRGATVDSVRTLRLEQILTLKDWESQQKPLQTRIAGFRPFLAVTDFTNQVMAPDKQFLNVYLREKALEEEKKRQKYLPPILPNNEPNAETMLRHVYDGVFGTLSVNENSDKNPDGKIIPVSYSEQQNVLDNSFPVTTSGLTISSGEISTNENSAQNSNTAALSAQNELQRSFWGESGVILLVILGHIAIVLGLVHIGHCHFSNIATGVSAAMLYLLLPYVNQMTGRLDHIIPGAFIIWAVALYRRPFFSGMCIGIAASLIFHPIFLLPIWCSYYWKRGLFRFLIGVFGVILVFYTLLLFSPHEMGNYGQQLLNMLGVHNFRLRMPDGIWEDFDRVYRTPVIVVFAIFCIGMVFWPSRKHLATLMSCSTIILIGMQFWLAHQGGLYIAWYLPLLIITLFRPNLEDRVALASVINY